MSAETIAALDAALADGFTPPKGRGHGGGRSALQEAARRLGVADSTLDSRIAKLRQDGRWDWPKADFEVAAPPSKEVPVEELIGRLCSDYARRAAHEEASRLVEVTVNLDGPIGLLVFGDPHLDSKLTNMPAVLRDVSLVQRTKGLFGVNLGDTTDNWTGKLAGLAAGNPVTDGQAVQLAKWFVESVDWLLLLLGNHCFWSGVQSPMKWLARQEGVLASDWSQRIALKFPNGREVRINHKHGFNGRSMWHAMHGQLKEMRFGARDHLYTGGHIHQAGWLGPLVDAGTGDWMHALQVGSYKDLSDEFGKRLGGGHQNAFPSAVVVIDPEARKQDSLLSIFPNTDQGADYLTWLRARHASGRSLAA